MPDRFSGMQDSPQVIEVTIEYHSGRRGLAGLGDRTRRTLSTIAVALIAVGAAIVVVGPLFSGTHRTTGPSASPSALRCDNGPTQNVFFGYRPPRAPTPATSAACR